MFERFSDAARRSVVTAAEEARGLNHNYIGTEHLLLGLLRHDDTAGCRLLRRFDVPVDWARERVVEIVGRGEGSVAGHLPFTPRAKKVLELSLREALQLRDTFIGSEHVLLGLLREHDGLAAQMLAERGVTLGAVREALPDIEREQAPDDQDAPRMVDVGPAQRIEAAHEHGDMVHVPASDFARLLNQVARLRDLLRHHGIDPEEQLPEGPDPGPGLGEDGGPPVA